MIAGAESKTAIGRGASRLGENRGGESLCELPRLPSVRIDGDDGKRVWGGDQPRGSARLPHTAPRPGAKRREPVAPGRRAWHDQKHRGARRDEAIVVQVAAQRVPVSIRELFVDDERVGRIMPNSG